MPSVLDSEQFHIEYKEDSVSDALLWESHCHAEFEMISVLAGDVSILLEGRTYRLTEGRTVISPPLRYQMLYANRKGLYQRVTARFPVTAIPDVLKPHFTVEGAPPSVFPSEIPQELRRIVRKGAHGFYAPLAESMMVRLFYDAVTADREAHPSEIDETLGMILSYVDAHISEPITLSSVAAHVARSESSVSHLFREKMGISPKQYVLRKKLALAEQLIRNGVPPTAAAVQIGYDNYGNFYRMYRKHLSASPSDGCKEKRAED